MGKPLRHATVLFLLGLLAMASLLGGESARPLGFGGPADEEWRMQARSNLFVDGELAGSDQVAGGGPAPTAAVLYGHDLLTPVREADLVRGAAAPEATTAARQRVNLAGSPAADEPQEAAVVQERPLLLTHVVQRGETLWDIARRYGIDVDTIVAANDLVDINRLQVGQQLKILTVRGALHTVRRGESLWDIARAYEVSMDEIVAANRLADPSRLQVSQQLIIPGAQAQAAALRREALVSSSGQLLRNFDWPLTGRISSRFGPRWGRMHQGLDIAVPTGTPVRAAAAGTVTYAGAMGGYGNIVIIDHGNRVETRYAHNSRIVVRVGQRVKRGEVIAYSGNTGNSTGPHLHFEIRYRGTPVNPEHYLKR